MGRKLQITWHESENDLYRLYRRETNPHRRSHLHALWLLRQGKSLTEVAPVIGVHYRTLQSWVSWYRQGGLQEVLRRTPGYNAPGRVPKLTRIQTGVSPKIFEREKKSAKSSSLRVPRQAAQSSQPRLG